MSDLTNLQLLVASNVGTLRQIDGILLTRSKATLLASNVAFFIAIDLVNNATLLVASNVSTTSVSGNEE